MNVHFVFMSPYLTDFLKTIFESCQIVLCRHHPLHLLYKCIRKGHVLHVPSIVLHKTHHTSQVLRPCYPIIYNACVVPRVLSEKQFTFTNYKKYHIYSGAFYWSNVNLCLQMNCIEYFGNINQFYYSKLINLQCIKVFLL